MVKPANGPNEPAPARGRDDFARFVNEVIEAVRTELHAAPGLTPNEVASVLRVSQGKVLAWITSGELVATNTAAALCGKPRWVVSASALEAFRKKRSSLPLPKVARRRRPSGLVDYFPDSEAA
ncbi:helix-turn-helix domain-containing protein [Gemmata sp. G18]|uniref:Helix-turn-helix domain-containing protein n=1 Tax=Gemmata palustris TaxID=2822762 RepID=A0ABS5BXN1_9BACT|nr:helix-turn-helix domain-containing protein [Gemmata palustris]MBP3958425.1 helix-turn-helix domain-containing protein [Gemmata palustris]